VWLLSLRLQGAVVEEHLLVDPISVRDDEIESRGGVLDDRPERALEDEPVPIGRPGAVSALEYDALAVW
jgi:hypothetical protein